MLKAVDIIFSRTNEGQVGNLKAFCSPILNSDLVEFIVFGGNEDLGWRYSAIVAGKAHDVFKFG